MHDFPTFFRIVCFKHITFYPFNSLHNRQRQRRYLLPSLLHFSRCHRRRRRSTKSKSKRKSKRKVLIQTRKKIKKGRKKFPTRQQHHAKRSWASKQASQPASQPPAPPRHDTLKKAEKKKARKEKSLSDSLLSVSLFFSMFCMWKSMMMKTGSQFLHFDISP